MLTKLITQFLLRTLLGVFLFALLLGGASAWLYHKGLEQPLALPEGGLDYRVRNGMSLRQVAQDMARKDVMSYPIAVTWLAAGIFENKAHQIKAGEFHIPLGSSARDVLEQLIQGKTLQHFFRLQEGWNFKRMLRALAANEKLKHELKDVPPEQVMSKLGYPDVHPEGRFFPDTYHFESDTSDIELLQRAYERMQEELAEAWAGRAKNLPLKSPEDALILASIIEKETGAAEEREQIAGVFIRRLNKGMRLQTDPTVIYGMGDKYDGDIRKADLKRDTPYNTYVHGGLPPTPIAMPGRGALRASVNPDNGDALFFVAKGGGKHYFSSNFKEHQCAVLRYQIKTKAPHLLRRRCSNKPHCRVCQETS